MSEIRTSGPLLFTEPNSPTRAGEIVNSIDEILNIPAPRVGMIVYVKSTKLNYIVRSLKKKEIDGVLVDNAQVDEFEQYDIIAEKERAEAVEAELGESIGDVHNVLDTLVINNLITGGADKALSADMGKALNERINGIKPVIYEGSTINNAPDEEDFTSENDLLKLKDRSYGDGMGYVILRKNKAFIEQVTKANTIYEIRYNFDLGGGTVEIPENCVLKFDGGSLSNGVIIGNNTDILAHDGVIFNNIKLVDVKNIRYSFFSEEYRNTESLMACLYNQTYVDFENSTFILDKTLNIEKSVVIKNLNIIVKSVTDNNNIVVSLYNASDIELDNVNIDGNSCSSIGIKAYNCNTIKISDSSIINIKERDDSNTGSRGIYALRCSNVAITNTSIEGVSTVQESTIGSIPGSARGLLLEYCDSINVKNCRINNVISKQDGDGICLHGNYDDDNVESIKIKIIDSCYFSNISRSHVKIQDRGVIIRNCVMCHTGEVASEQVIRIYENNCEIRDNKIVHSCNVAVGIGSVNSTQLHDIVVADNNIIALKGADYSGIVTSICALANFVFQGNTITCSDESIGYYYLIYIRNHCNNIVISSNNYITPSTNGQVIEFRSDVEETKFENILITNNSFTGNKWLLRFNYIKPFTLKNAIISGNILNLTGNTAGGAITTLQPSSDGGDIMLNIAPEINEFGNTTNTGYILFRKIGYSNHKPVLPNSMLGYMYLLRLDQNTLKPIWWNGSNWQDASGNFVASGTTGDDE